MAKPNVLWVGILLAQTPIPSTTPWKNSPFAYPPREFEKRMKIQSSSAVMQAKREEKRRIEGAPVDTARVLEWVGGSVPSEIVIGRPLDRGQRMVVPEGDVVRLGFPWGAQAVLAPGSIVVMPADAYPIPALQVEKGSVRFLVSQLSGVLTPKRPVRFLVVTPDGVVGVRGTDFVVEVMENRSIVRVSLGKVWLAKSPDDLMKVKTRKEMVAPSVIDLEKDKKVISGVRDWDWYPWIREFESNPPAIGAQIKKVLLEQKSRSMQRIFAPGPR